MRYLFLLTALIALMGVSAARAEIVANNVEYDHEGTTLEGYLAYDDAIKGPRPGVLIVHQWTGITDHERAVARKLAGMGYLAMCADIYGKGIRPSWGQESGEVSGKYKSDRPLLRARVNRGLEELKAQPQCDATKTGAIGYCFGGMTVLELARSGADVDAVVSFHGNLDTPTPEDAKNIKAAVLVCHGGEDPFVPDEQVVTFFEEMRKGDVADWQFVVFDNAGHSFTEVSASDNGVEGVAYNEDADRRSWNYMKMLFDEKFN